MIIKQGEEAIILCKSCQKEINDNAIYCENCKERHEIRQKLIDDYNLKRDVPSAKNHHWCLLVYLVAIIFFTSIKILSYIPTSLDPIVYVPGTEIEWNPWTHWLAWVDVLLGIALIGFAIAVWKWKKWSIYGFLTIAVANFIAGIVGKPGIMTTYIMPDTATPSGTPPTYIPYLWIIPINTNIIIAAVVIMYLTIIGFFLISLWKDRASGWNQLE